MAWIEFHDDIWEHHKTERFADMLGLPTVYAVGHLASLWHFVLRNAWRDANLAPWGDRGIERAARWEGEPGKFVHAARECGVLDGSVVHGWMERAGKLVQDRLYNEQRKKNADLRRKTDATVPYPTVPNLTQPTTTTGDDSPSAVGFNLKTPVSGDYGDYRLPKNFGRYGGVHVSNVPHDECQFLIDTMRPGPKVKAALEWRMAQKESEATR